MYSNAEMETVRRELEVVTAERDALRNLAHDNATARDAYLSGMNEAREELKFANRSLSIAQAERDTAMDALSKCNNDVADWRGAAESWQARYKGMEAALRVVLEVANGR